MEVCYVKPMDFGMGIDSLTMRPRNPNAVTVPGLKSVQGSGDTQTALFSLVNAESLEDFESAFSFSADAAATFGMFGGSGSFDYSQSHKFHSYSHFLVVSIKVTNTFKQIDKPKLNPDTNAFALLQNGQQDLFQHEFGDAFVLGIQQGGVFYAVLEFRTTTEEELHELSSSITAGELGLFETAGKFSSRMNSFKGTKNLKVDSFQQGGTDLRVRIDIDGIIERAVNFPAQVKLAAESYFATLLDYRALDLPAPPNAIKIENAKLVIQRYYKLRSQLLQTLNDIEYIKLNPDQFVNPELVNFDEIEVKLTDALNLIRASASQCADNVNACAFVPISLPTIKLPKRIGVREMAAAFASKGEVIARDDALASLILAKQAGDANRQGFLIGLGIAEGHTLPGPGKDKFGAQLAPELLAAYQFGVRFSVDRNLHLEWYTRGLAALKADPATAGARDGLPAASWVGFAIGSGLFAPVAIGGAGHTLEGPGSTRIRDELSAANQQGFRVALAFHLHH